MLAVALTAVVDLLQSVGLHHGEAVGEGGSDDDVGDGDAGD